VIDRRIEANLVCCATTFSMSVLLMQSLFQPNLGTGYILKAEKD
jgi:hypothetical protein